MSDFKIGDFRPPVMWYVDNDRVPHGVKDIYYGSEWIWTEIQGDYTRNRTTSGYTTIDPPGYECWVDYVLVGGGGGGDSGHGGNNTAGNSGATGKVSAGSVRFDGLSTIGLSVGAGGYGGTGNPSRLGGNGFTTRLYAGATTRTAEGGLAGGNLSWHGQGEKRLGTYSYHGVSFNLSGYGVGGRGGDGGILGRYQHGSAGSSGYAWVRIRKIYPY